MSGYDHSGQGLYNTFQRPRPLTAQLVTVEGVHYVDKARTG